MISPMQLREPAYVPAPKMRSLPPNLELLSAPMPGSPAEGLMPPRGLPTPAGLPAFRPPPGLEPPPMWFVAALHSALVATALSGGTLAREAPMKPLRRERWMRTVSSDSSGRVSSLGSETCSTADPADDIPSSLLTPFRRQTAMADLLAASEPTQAPKPPSFVVHLFDALVEEPARCCSPACPSVGSVGHNLGVCRPCDFFGRGFDCRAGANCSFCHLCGPVERRQRKVQRRKVIREMVRATTGAE
mmetsp:Transcript_14594/g.37772  ORF Transcript_14594/g.37772 Transcript_14594/m.37772 type:complete len:246 (+) Transcript_14594:82-819(+)